MTGIEEAALGSALLPEIVPEAGMALSATPLLEPMMAAEIGGGLGSAGMLGAEMAPEIDASAGLLNPASATGFPWSKLAGGLGKGLLGMGQQSAPRGGGVAAPPPMGQVTGAAQTVANRFSPRQMPQTGQQGMSLQNLDPYTLTLLRQMGLSV